jgi:hypothetical protein
MWTLWQDYVAAKIHGTSFSQVSSSLNHQQRSAASPSGSSTPGSDRRQAESRRAEKLHEAQAALNQLKEVPVKGMHAFLLVAPLLDHGESRAHYDLHCLAQSESTAAMQTMAAALVQSRQQVHSRLQPQSQSESCSQSVLIIAHVVAANNS